MKETSILLACLLIAPLAFAQPSETKKTNNHGANNGYGKNHSNNDGGSVSASYQPLNTLVVREDRSRPSGHYILDGAGHALDKEGKVVQTRIRHGAHIRVYYMNTGTSRAIDHVVLVD